MDIQKFTNSIAQENTYLLSNSSALIVIDPGSEPLPLIEKINDFQLPLVAILLTHAHFDHIMGLEALKEQFPDTPIYLHSSEKDWLKTPELNGSSFALGKPVYAPEADIFYESDQFYNLENFKFQLLETPGHSIGGVSLFFPEEKVVFSGDALFKNSIGRTDLPTGNYEQLIHSIKTVLFHLPEDTRVLAGHGPETRISTEKTFNPFL